jgi:hypothetical protein
MELMKTHSENSTPMKDIGNTLSDVEKVLSDVQKTLGELDRALSNVEQTLNGVEESLGSKESTLDEAKLISHYQLLYDPVAQAAVESALAGAEEQEHEQLFDLDSMEYGPSTGDTLQWYHDQDNRELEEALDFKRLAHAPMLGLADEELLRRESDLVGSSGYSADDERSPPMGKGLTAEEMECIQED